MIEFVEPSFTDRVVHKESLADDNRLLQGSPDFTETWICSIHILPCVTSYTTHF